MTDAYRPGETGSPNAPVEPATGAPVPPPNVPPPPPVAPPPVEPPPPMSVPTVAPAAPEKGGGGKGAIIIVGGLIAFVAIVLFLVRNNVEADDLAVGDCFNIPSATSVSTVEKFPCNESHNAEVFFVGEYTGDSYPISLTLDSYVTDNCEPAFETYLGRELDEEPELSVGYFYPTREGWDDGDKTITCYVAQPDEGPMTESLKAGS